MQIKQIEMFLQHMIKNLIPSYVSQEACGTGKDYWNADFWTIEVAKCLYVGEKEYRQPEYTPSKFIDNKHFNKENIITHADNKLRMFQRLQELKNEAQCLLVCEVGRGLDILIANMVKNWQKIWCYDQNKVYNEYLKQLWSVTFYPEPTVVFNPVFIKKPTIMLMNHSKLRDYTKFRENKNIVHAIVDGVLIW